MPTPTNKELYQAVKEYADIVYNKPSAYKSGFIVKTYKKLGGTYKNDNKEHDLERWFLERWKNIGDGEYPVYRPTKRINKNTPLTIDEIDKKNLKSQIKLKQKIKGTKNLPPFKAKKFI
jgi:hypothetical protein